MNRKCKCRHASASHPYRACCHQLKDHPGYKYTESQPNEIILTERLGGEVGGMVHKLVGHEVECLGACHNKIQINSLFGYFHSGGLADNQGRKIWVYARCPSDGYEMAWWKIEHRV